MSSYLPMWMASSLYLETGPRIPGLGTTGYLGQMGRIYIALPSRPNDFKLSTRQTYVDLHNLFSLSHKARRGEKTYKNVFHILRDTHLLKKEQGEGRKGREERERRCFLFLCSRGSSFAFV